MRFMLVVHNGLTSRAFLSQPDLSKNNSDVRAKARQVLLQHHWFHFDLERDLLKLRRCLGYNDQVCLIRKLSFEFTTDGYELSADEASNMLSVVDSIPAVEDLAIHATTTNLARP
jgi:hypothetical protein